SALVQTTGEGHLQGVLPDSRAVLCIPITYVDTLLGVLNVESQNEDAFTPQDVLIMNTLADLLATALHNAFVFQKLQQQSITDGLTGIKTRRFFWEALSSEWKRASRSGRPFSVVLMDLDKFKEVNDTLGHLEGDLVLARVGRLLEQKCRQSNVVARYGGDEDCNVQVLRESIEALNRAAESRELTSSSHGELVARYCEVVARALGLPPEEVTELAYAGRVHDVGKIFVPERILNKSGPLTEEEFYLVRLHAKVGSEIVGTVPGSQKLQKAIEHHHEAFDGTGYPAGLSGEAIPLWARIISIADAYVNMINERSFAAA